MSPGRAYPGPLTNDTTKVHWCPVAPFFPTAVEGCPKITLILNPNPNPKNLKINETSFYRGGNKIVAARYRQ